MIFNIVSNNIKANTKRMQSFFGNFEIHANYKKKLFLDIKHFFFIGSGYRKSTNGWVIIMFVKLSFLLRDLL